MAAALEAWTLLNAPADVPELPEVEVVRAGLAPAVTGATIAAVEVLDERALTRHDRAHPATSRRSPPVRASTRPCAAGSSCGCRSARERAIVGHLGMSGQMLLRTPDHAGDDRHARIRLHLEHPEHGELRVDFVDQRTFGSLAVDRLVPTADGAGGRVLGGRHRASGHAASRAGRPHRPRPARSARSPTPRSSRRSRGASSGVKRVLLDQGVVSGVGNIYADESLWAVRLHPDQPASSMRARRCARAARGRARGARQGARRGRHELRRAVRQRQRGVRVLRALAERLRAGRAAVPALRHARWCASRS